MSHAPCQIEIDRIDADAWHRILTGFDDASLYQTWCYGAERWGEKSLSHILLERDGEVVGAGQLALVKVPLLGAGAAYLAWGPLWRRRDREPDPDVLRQLLSAVRKHYAEGRGLVVRIMPRLFEDEGGDAMRTLLEAGGYRARPRLPTYRTLLLDLERPLEEIQGALSSQWRRHLRRAQKQDVQVRELKGSEAVTTFLRLYADMRRHKGFVEFSDVDLLEACQAGLPEALKLRVVACLHREQPVAAVVISLLGDTPIYHYGATSSAGRELRAGYRLHWWVVSWLREQGYRSYDLGGLEMDSEPGVNRFKAGLAGDGGRDLCLLGKYDAGGNVPSRAVVGLGDGLRAVGVALKRARRWIPG